MLPSLRLYDIAGGDHLLELFSKDDYSGRVSSTLLGKLHVAFTQYGTPRTNREYTVTKPIPFFQLTSLSMELYEAEDEDWIESIRFPRLRNLLVECKGWDTERMNLVEALRTAIGESRCKIETLQLHFSATVFPASWDAYEQSTSVPSFPSAM